MVLDTEQKTSEWRVNFKSMLDGAGNTRCGGRLSSARAAVDP